MPSIPSMIGNFSYYIGLITLLYFSIQFLQFVYLHVRPTSIRIYHYGPAPWALITGASDGIGLALARQLASHDFNIVLHGRNPSKLERVRSGLIEHFPNIAVRIAVADAASPDWSSAVNNVLKAVQDLHLTVLINNVGGTGALLKPPIKTFEDTTNDEIENLINLNLRFPTQLTRCLLPVISKVRGPKLIMNIGSLAASGAPLASVYGGCKAFNHAWSKGWQAELQSTRQKVEVLTMIVGGVTETAHRKTASTIFTPDAGTMARAAVQKVGCGRAEVVGYWSHGVQSCLLRLVPDAVLGRLKVEIMKRVRLEEGKSQ
ncbi:MAG: hypothetical protein LQ338_002573 [Usnochroma carphineum]|nr:MAG: hypothetical protein LQ338_002573 [Usnochroma carphineum]